MEATLSDLELQQELERFATQFSDRVTQAAERLERSPRERVRDEALKKSLLYVSSAIEIATGPYPEVNILDMVVFIRLARTVLERHWIPNLYGHEGDGLAEVFAKAERELSNISAQALGPEQREELAALVDAWLAENPGQLRVEGVRLSDFSAAAGSAAAERAGQAKGLLSSVKAAAQTANQAMLLSDRALFLVHRLPFLWRLQARLGAREMLSDAMTRLSGPLVRRGLLYLGLLGAGGMLMWRLGLPARR
jgi:hypothetical protein